MKTYQQIIGDGGSDILGQVGAQNERLRVRLAQMTRKIAVMSGKGGVGKSAVTVNLAAGLARRGWHVGILDADINGPSIARMLGLRGQRLRAGAHGVRPASGALGIRTVSLDLLLPRDAMPVVWNAPNQRDSFVWRGAMEASALKELLADTDWGSLDFLLVDLPPGAERLPHVLSIVPDLDGCLAVTIPSAVAWLAVRRSIALAREHDTRVLGLVENMAGYLCLKCGAPAPLFPHGATETSDVPLWARLPFVPLLAECCDRGVPYVAEHWGSPVAELFVAIARRIEGAFADHEETDDETAVHHL